MKDFQVPKKEPPDSTEFLKNIYEDILTFQDPLRDPLTQLNPDPLQIQKFSFIVYCFPRYRYSLRYRSCYQSITTIQVLLFTVHMMYPHAISFVCYHVIRLFTQVPTWRDPVWQPDKFIIKVFTVESLLQMVTFAYITVHNFVRLFLYLPSIFQSPTLTNILVWPLRRCRWILGKPILQKLNYPWIIKSPFFIIIIISDRFPLCSSSPPPNQIFKCEKWPSSENSRRPLWTLAVRPPSRTLAVTGAIPAAPI